MKKIKDHELFLKNSNENLLNMLKEINCLPTGKIDKLNNEKTLIIVVDVINGFTKEGVFANPLGLNIIKPIQDMLKKMPKAKKMFVIDTHKKTSTEFSVYPEHCVEGTTESEVVDELKPYITEESILVHKNSTNAFVSPEFLEHINENTYDNIIVCGLCTDICVSSCALTLKEYFNQWEIPTEIIMPVDSVETFDSLTMNHYGELINLITLYRMKSNGIKLVNTIK